MVHTSVVLLLVTPQHTIRTHIRYFIDAVEGDGGAFGIAAPTSRPQIEREIQQKQQQQRKRDTNKKLRERKREYSSVDFSLSFSPSPSSGDVRF